MDFIDRHGVGRWLVNFLMILLLLGASLYLHGLAAESRADLDAEVHQRCLEAQANRAALRRIILRGRDVGKRGTPGYAYYRAHPREKRVALRRVDQALADLPAIDCT